MRSSIRSVPSFLLCALLCVAVARPVAAQGGGCPMMRGQSGMHGGTARGMSGMSGRMAMHARMAAMHGGMGRMAGGMGGMAGMGGASGDTAPRPAAARAPAQAGCPAVTAKAVERGREVYGGAGSCFVCHGLDARGSALGPNLTDREWVDIDGSYGAIVRLVHSGVAHPKHAPAPMPPRGGTTITDADICAVSAYVHSLSARR